MAGPRKPRPTSHPSPPYLLPPSSHRSPTSRSGPRLYLLPPSAQTASNAPDLLPHAPSAARRLLFFLWCPRGSLTLHHRAVSPPPCPSQRPTVCVRESSASPRVPPRAPPSNLQTGAPYLAAAQLPGETRPAATRPRHRPRCFIDLLSAAGGPPHLPQPPASMAPTPCPRSRARTGD